MKKYIIKDSTHFIPDFFDKKIACGVSFQCALGGGYSVVTEFKILNRGKISISDLHFLHPGIFHVKTDKSLDFIKEHRKGRYTALVSECRLNEYLHKIDLEATKLLEAMISRLAAERGIDENLKDRDMLGWVAEMNNIKASAEEIVLREVVYV